MRKKIFAFAIFLILLSIGVTSIMTYRYVREDYVSTIEESLIKECYLINSFIETKDLQLENFDFQQYAITLKSKIQSRVTFIDKEGKVIGDSDIASDKLESVENHLYRKEIKEASAEKIGQAIRHSATLGIDFMYVAVPYYQEGILHGFTRISVPLYAIEELNKEIMLTVLFSSLVAFVFALILGVVYARKIVHPIEGLREFANRIGEGNYSEKTYITGKDEIGDLAKALNHMSEKLSSTINALEENNSRLTSTLFSMKEAMIAVDTDYKIIMINQAAKALFGVGDEAIGLYMLKTIRNTRLYEIFEKILKENFTGQQEVEDYHGSILKINTSYIRSEKDGSIIGLLALIEDVTQIHKLENMRKDFVSNVSHELKTPLTSISGFLETLQNGAADNPEVRNRFLDIIAIETSRLKRLIDDILILSDIENKKNQTIERVDVKEAISEVIALLESEAKKRNITLQSYFPQDEVFLEKGNRDRFKQMILNLTDNAIKYSNEGKDVEIILAIKPSKIEIKVKDQGIGIPEVNMSRLFERFYRVDEARSKEVGGTGLGLAIVKHIVLLFNGEIKVESAEGQGSIFTITLPR